MRIQLTKPMFPWDCLEDSPTLKTVNQFLETIPDAKLFEERNRPAKRILDVSGILGL